MSAFIFRASSITIDGWTSLKWKWQPPLMFYKICIFIRVIFESFSWKRLQPRNISVMFVNTRADLEFTKHVKTMNRNGVLQFFEMRNCSAFLCLWSCTSKQHVSNWRYKNKIPASEGIDRCLVQSKTNRGSHRYNFMHDYSTFQRPRITQITLNTLLSLQHKEINVMGVVV